MKILQNLCLILSFFYLINSEELNLRPIVGIISIPSDVSKYPSEKWSYFPSSYVKFIESAGAQVVPIQYDLPRDKMLSMLKKVNGVLLTGGNSVFVDENGKKNPIAESLEFIVNYIVDENLKGNYYPLWGTCQGFQVIAMILANDYNLLTHCSQCLDKTKNHIFETSYDSKLFKDIDVDFRYKIENNQLSWYWHNWKIDAKAFQSNSLLTRFLTPITYSYDDAGTKYVSAFESPFLPIYAIQYHQEFASFEFIDNIANHGHDAVSLQLHLSNFFVNEARKNHNKFPDSEDYVIENYNATTTFEYGFSTIYLFPLRNQTSYEEVEI